MKTIDHQSSWEYLSYIYTNDIYIYINKRFSLIEWKSRTNLKVANKAETFFGQTIHYLFSLSIHILRAQTEYESRERRPLMGFTLPPHPSPYSFSLSSLSASIGPDPAPETESFSCIASIGRRVVQTHTHTRTPTRTFLPPLILSLYFSFSVCLSGVMSCCETVKSLEATLD